MRKVRIRGPRKNAGVPLQARSVLDQMVAEGRATRAHGDLLDVKPRARISGKRPLSEVLARIRAVER